MRRRAILNNLILKETNRKRSPCSHTVLDKDVYAEHRLDGREEWLLYSGLPPHVVELGVEPEPREKRYFTLQDRVASIVNVLDSHRDRHLGDLAICEMMHQTSLCIASEEMRKSFIQDFRSQRVGGGSLEDACSNLIRPFVCAHPVLRKQFMKCGFVHTSPPEMDERIDEFYAQNTGRLNSLGPQRCRCYTLIREQCQWIQDQIDGLPANTPPPLNPKLDR